MDLDDRLAQAWRNETHDSVPLQSLRARIKAQRRRRVLQRTVEAALTLAALAVFGLALLGSGMTPMHWMLLPFYAVFLPVAWVLVLHAPGQGASDVAENVHTFARLRMAQLRASLREIHIARRVAVALLIYAALAAGTAGWIGGADWHRSAGKLLLVALLWAVGTQLVTAPARRRRLREYRAMRRLVG